MGNYSQIKRVAVLGAGVMGAQIAAHLVNAGFETLLFDLPSKKGPLNTVVLNAVRHLNKLKPSPVANKLIAEKIIAQNYDEDLINLSHCDLIIEAVAERFDIKASLYKIVAPHVAPDAIFVSNTSGLSINKLSELLPEALQTRFCGVHFFNPPRYMPLLELIPSNKTAPNLLDCLETFFVKYLGKGVVRAKDTPNFIANRIGVFSMLATIHHATRLGLPLDTVDSLTGPFIGRAKSATFRTMDVVGLDTMAHVVQTMKESLKDDPWHEYFDMPKWMTSLIEKGALGQKTGAGIYKKVGRLIHVLDTQQDKYVEVNSSVSEEVKSILKVSCLKQRFKLLVESKDKQAQFLWACFRDLFHYCAHHLPTIASNTRDLDLAIRFGFAWQQGPFEIWQLAGLEEVKEALLQDIEANKTMSSEPLSQWVNQISAFYSDNGALNPTDANFEARSSLPVYQRQISYDTVLCESNVCGETVFEDEAVRLWTLDKEIVILSFKSKANCIGVDVLEGINKSIELAEQQYKGIVLWQESATFFSVGANLKQFMNLFESDNATALKEVVYQFQRTLLKLKYSAIPAVAALRGQALGGGCELVMHCDDVVCALESYVGLVEIGVGLLPAAGGLKELALRAQTLSNGAPSFQLLERYFKMVAMAEVSGSGVDAKDKGFLGATTNVLMNTHEVLYTAIKKAHFLSDSNYLPPMKEKISVLGRDANARLNMIILNMAEGGFISEHDKLIAEKIAYVLSGGDLNEGEKVDEEWFLKLEIDAFLSLAQTTKTKERISHLLRTGKPLRN